jgi:cobalt-zinc-cadmium efflux system membrane fusion protein
MVEISTGAGGLLTGGPRSPIALLLALLPTLASACSDGGNRATAGHVEGEEAGEGTHVIHVEVEAAEAWGLKVGPVGRTDITAEMELPGVLTTNGNRTARIASLVAGQVAERMVDLGSRVAEGQLLVALNSPEFTRAQTAFLQAFAQVELSRKDFERAIVLRDQRAIEEREFLRRQSLYEQQLAELRAAEVILHSLGVEDARLRAMTAGLDVNRPLEDHTAVEALLPIRSPIAGVVIQRDVLLGDPVEPGHTLFTVSDLSVLWAQLDAYEEQLPGLRQHADVVLRTPVFPDQGFPGRVSVIADQVDPELRTVGVRVEVPNPDGLLRPNMYVQGFLRVRSPEAERLILPEEAVQLLDGRAVVFVALPPEPGEDHLHFEERVVVPGETLTEGQTILDGLDGTERVVTRGAFTLKSEMTKGAGGHDHVH